MVARRVAAAASLAATLFASADAFSGFMGTGLKAPQIRPAGLTMSLEQYKEELAATAKKIAAPGK